jgi:hypothetical protein
MLLCNLVNAQDKYSPKIGIGGHYGFNYSNVRFIPSIRSRPVVMNSYGLVFYYLGEKYLGIQFEANYTERGWESGSDTTFYNKRRMSFLEFPMLTNINVGGKHIRFIFNAGPYLAFFRESYEGFKVETDDANSTKSIFYNPHKNQEQYTSMPNKDIDYGYCLGIAFGFHSFAGDILLRARYTQGLTNLFPQYPEGTYKFSQMQTYYAGISYTYEFSLKPKH